MKPSVVFDTNIYISAILFGGNPRQCLELARSGEIQLFASRAILLETALKLEEKFSWSSDDVKEVIQGLLVFTTVIKPHEQVAVIKQDPDDNHILACAAEISADFIISGDKKHLLSLKTFRNIPILSAKEFLVMFYRKS